MAEKNSMKVQYAMSSIELIKKSLVEYQKQVKESNNVSKVNLLNSGLWINSKDAKLGACKIFNQLLEGITTIILKEGNRSKP